MGCRGGIGGNEICPGCTSSKRKGGFNESAVTRDMNTTRNEVKTSITFVLVRITKKNTGKRARSEFMR